MAKNALKSQEPQTYLRLEEWVPPELDDKSLRFSVGDSVLADFVLGHDHSAILRELVQNEYDAAGSSMRVHFGANSLQIVGTGKPIDKRGWRRLSVMLGTGLVDGHERRIEPKTNGIGIKNLGLRSLFLFGDRIYVRSNGKQTVLNRLKGTRAEPAKDELTKGKPGIRIDVPYRTSKSDRFEPFGKDQEESALNSFIIDLTPTLMKLAQPGARRRLGEISVVSDRLSRQITWKQTVKRAPCHNRSVNAIKRQIRVSDSQQKASALEEFEWQRVYEVPGQFHSQGIPGYFKVSQNRIRLGLSLRISRGKVDLKAPGIFFYPLGVPRGYTGNAISLNAPFEMDADRTQIIDPESSLWNRWLLDKAIDLTFDLLVTDWYKRFGPAAYIMLEELTKASTPYYLNGVTSLLGKDPCWPTRARQSGSKSRTKFVQAEKLVVPANPSLDEFLSKDAYLDDPIGAHPGIQVIVKKYGAKSFGINSLVRLRCAGKNGENLLATKLQVNEANYYYMQFPEALINAQQQAKFSNALDSNPQQLSARNRQDLTLSRTTLTAAGGLKAPRDLWAVDRLMLSVCGVPEVDRLHSCLTDSKVIRGLCKKFNPEKWAGDVAQKIRTATATEEERVALYQYILSTHGEFGKKLQGLLRRTPVLLDHQGEWTAPSSITIKKVKGAKELKDALHFPNREYERDARLAQSMKFKDKITGNDIVEFVEAVAGRPEMITGLDPVLYRFKHLLTNKIVERLKHIPFLPSSLGKQDYPRNLYLRNQRNQLCLGERAAYVTGTNSKLYVRLGCKERPGAADIIAYLEELNEKCVCPPNAQVLYSALIDALEREKKPKTSYAHEEILWTGSEFCCPYEALVGARHQNVFFQSVPQVIGIPQAVQNAYLLLGAHKVPTPYHWHRLLLWFGLKYGQTGGPVTGQEKNALRKAYGSISDLPPHIIRPFMKCLLDSKGKLHSQTDLQSGRYVIDDDPLLAGAINQRGIQLAFADTTDKQALHFYLNLGIKSLSEVRRRLRPNIGQRRQPPNHAWISESLEQLHWAAFLSALESLAAHMFLKHPGVSAAVRAQALKKIQSIRDIYFVEHLEVNYQVAGITIPVPAKAVIEKDQLILSRVRSESELRGLLAGVLAELFVDDLGDQRNFADALFRLLASGDIPGLKEYLKSRGIPWELPSRQPGEETSVDTEEFENDEGDQTQELIKEILRASLSNKKGDRKRTPAPPVTGGESETEDFEENGEDDSSEDWTLPPFESVKIKVLKPSEDWPPSSIRPGRPGGDGGWHPSSPRDQERDAAYGNRGEQIVYTNEIARIKGLGYPESRVVWASKADPGCDYDILSVDEDGQDLWIEVKSTTAKDGRFQWSKAEFQKALQEGERYVLWRVYEVDTETPSIAPFRNPIALLSRGVMRIDIKNFNAEIAPLSSAR